MSDVYRTAAERPPIPPKAKPKRDPHIEDVDGARVLRKCRVPGWWARVTKFNEGDVWECPECTSEYRAVGGVFFGFWLPGFRAKSPGEKEALARAEAIAKVAAESAPKEATQRQSGAPEGGQR